MKKVDLLNIVNKYSKDENYDFNGYLMYKDKEIAQIKDTNFIKSLEDNLLPIIMLNPNFDNNLALSGVLNDKALEKTWYSTSFTKNNYKPVLTEYNYDIPKVDFEKIKSIIDDILKSFPMLEKEDGFNDIVFKIIKSNYEELLN